MSHLPEDSFSRTMAVCIMVMANDCLGEFVTRWKNVWMLDIVRKGAATNSSSYSKCAIVIDEWRERREFGLKRKVAASANHVQLLSKGLFLCNSNAGIQCCS